MNELSLKSFNGLSELLSPLHYADLKPLPPTDPGDHAIAKTLTFRANISKDSKWSYMFNGPLLRCFPISVQKSTTTSKWSPKSHSNFVLNTSAYHFPNSIITCATELAVHSPRKNGITKLLVGLNCGSEGGALVIFDPVVGKPVKRISMPSPVSNVFVLSNLEESGHNRPFFSEALVAMVGIAAVGLHGGQLLLVDLGLDDPELNALTLPLYGTKTFKLMPVEPREEFIVPKRRTAAKKDLLICLDFRNQEFAESYDDYEPNTFYYKSTDELLKLSKETVFVTCMEYVPTTGSLVVGFNFGGFQIWRVDNLSLEFASNVNVTNTTGIPVHSICQQMPVDDPKHFCYLWVLYGTPILEMQVARAVLYAVLYEEQEETEQFGSVYKNLHSCLPRLSFDLQDFYFPQDGSVLENSFQEDNILDQSAIQRYAVRPIRIWNQSENLMFFAWECNQSDIYMIGIFDLNQWYSAQTPAKLASVQENQFSPFWTAISIKIPFTPIPGSRDGLFLQVYDIQVIPKTLERWENPHLRQDIHLFPASITFQSVCLSSIGTFTFEYFGIQEKLLRLIQKEGYQMLTEPAILRQLCESFGLSPFLTYNAGDEVSEYDADRFYILSALLESRRPSLIVQIANYWVDGSYANLDCTIDLILRWIKGYNYTLRMYVEEHWITLMTHGRDLPPETAHCLNYSNFVWNQINGLLKTLVRHDEIYDNSERNTETECLQYALDRLVPYSAALLMLNRAGILPVRPDFEVMSMLKSICAERRGIVKSAVTNCKFLEPEHKLIPHLLIDSLMETFQESFVESEWHVEESQFPYPPEHPVDIFNMLIGNWVGFESKLISRIIFYFILDITHLLDMTDTAGAHATLRGDFNSILKLSPDEQNAIIHLWLIDHGEFEKPLLYLCNGERLKDLDILPWAEACTLLAAQGCEVAILHILNHFCFPNAGKLYINLQCENQSTMVENLGELLTSGLFASDEEILFHCFTVAKDKGFLDHFISTKSRHAPTMVQESLVKYIKQLPHSYANENRLLRFFMLRKDDKNAEEHFEKMKITWKDPKNLTRNDQEHWDKLKLEMKSFLSCCRENFIMNFLGYESGQPGVLKPAPLKLTTKVIQGTPSPAEKNANNLPPALRKVVQELPQHSPLTIYKRKGRPSADNSNFRKSRLSESIGVTDLSILLKTPKIDRGKRTSMDESEMFSTPVGMHGILRSAAVTPKVSTRSSEAGSIRTSTDSTSTPKKKKTLFSREVRTPSPTKSDAAERKSPSKSDAVERKSPLRRSPEMKKSSPNKTQSDSEESSTSTPKKKKTPLSSEGRTPSPSKSDAVERKSPSRSPKIKKLSSNQPQSDSGERQSRSPEMRSLRSELDLAEKKSPSRSPEAKKPSPKKTQLVSKGRKRKGSGSPVMKNSPLDKGRVPKSAGQKTPSPSPEKKASSPMEPSTEERRITPEKKASSPLVPSTEERRITRRDSADRKSPSASRSPEMKKTPSPEKKASSPMEPSTEERRITRSQTKKLGISIDEISFTLNTSRASTPRRRSERAKSEEIFMEKKPRIRNTRATSEAPGNSPSITITKSTSTRKKSSDSFSQEFGAEPSFSMNLRKRPPPKLPDIYEYDVPKASTSKKRSRQSSSSSSKEPDIQDPSTVNITQVIEEMERQKRAKSGSPSPLRKSASRKTKEKVFGYAPTLSLVEETSSTATSPSAQSPTSPSILDKTDN